MVGFRQDSDVPTRRLQRIAVIDDDRSNPRGHLAEDDDILATGPIQTGQPQAILDQAIVEGSQTLVVRPKLAPLGPDRHGRGRSPGTSPRLMARVTANMTS